MYLLTVLQDESMVEASLGGRITYEEVQVLSDELSSSFSEFLGRPFQLLLDYSRAKVLDRDAIAALQKMKDRCIENGASKIVSVVQDEHELIRHTTDRLEFVVNGQEQFVTEPAKARFSDLTSADRLAS